MSATNSEYPKVTEYRLNEIRFRAEHGMEIASPQLTPEWIEAKLEKLEKSQFFQEHANHPDILDDYIHYYL